MNHSFNPPAPPWLKAQPNLFPQIPPRAAPIVGLKAADDLLAGGEGSKKGIHPQTAGERPTKACNLTREIQFKLLLARRIGAI